MYIELNKFPFTLPVRFVDLVLFRMLFQGLAIFSGADLAQVPHLL